MARSVFISHASEDAAVVTALAADLERRGWNVWLDAQQLTAGQRWAAEISAAVPASHVVIAVVSPAALASHWVDAELKLAVDHGRPILTVLVDQPDTGAVLQRYGLYLAGNQWIDFGGVSGWLDGNQLDEVAHAAASVAVGASAKPPGSTQRKVGTALLLIGCVGIAVGFGGVLVMMVGAFGDFGTFVDAVLAGSVEEVTERFRAYVDSLIEAVLPFAAVFVSIMVALTGLAMRRSARRKALQFRPV